MTETNKELISDEVEQGLEILEKSGDEAMDNFLFPRGLNWIKLYLWGIRGEIEFALSRIETIQENFILKDAEDIQSTSTFKLLTKNAGNIIKKSAIVKEIFLSHFGVDLDEARTKVCLDKEGDND